MKTTNTTTITALAASGLTLAATSFPAQAIQAGDMSARFTLTNVKPNDDATAFSTVAVMIQNQA